MSRRTYRVIAQRDGESWLLDVPAIERATQSRRLDQADAMARDLIAIMTGEPEDSFDIALDVSLDPRIQALVEQARQAKAAALAQQAAAAEAQRKVIERLERQGFTTRDTGRLLGLTHQRVAQLRAEQRRAGA